MNPSLASRATRVDVSLNVPQSRAFRAIREKRTICLPWGRGVGKSTFLRFVAFMLVAQWRGRQRIDPTTGREAVTMHGVPVRGIRVVFLMPTLKQFKDVHGAAYERENAEDWAFLGGKLDKTTWRISFRDGSWIQPFPAELANSRRARGLRADVVLTDETDDVDGAVFESVARPWFSEPFSLKIRLCGGTPTRGRHGLLYLLHSAGLSKDAKDSRYYTFHATYADAPETVDPDEVEDARQHSVASTFAREWLCDFDAAEGLIYPFDDAFHVREPPDPSTFTEFHCGCDHGWTDPGVLLLCGIRGHGEDAELWILDEHYATETPDHIWDGWAKEWDYYSRHKVEFWADRSRPDRLDALRRQGLSVHESDSSPGAIRAGISRVADMLFIRQSETVGPGFKEIVRRWARLYVAPRCVNTIREFGLYRRKKHSDGSFSDDPEDRDNHTQDCVRYVALGRFGRLPNYRHEASGR